MNTSHIFKFNKCITYTNILHVNKNQPFSTTDLRKKSKNIQTKQVHGFNLATSNDYSIRHDFTKILEFLFNLSF